ncbi:MAG: lipid-A-disaccharide synthase [Prolixibacteraceae bacterium]|nr:lipid-A-disaccharide synthase [Prolixibacteraceae bacterium]
MKYYLIAGETSGDMHAASLMAEIKKLDHDASFGYFGGDQMQLQGGVCYQHIKHLAFMGIVPVLLNLNAIRKNMALCRASLLEFQPDMLILVDYPGFNLRIARFAKRHNIRTAYYISPKVWAWKTQRVKLVKQFVDQMYTIFPFETSFYAQHQYPVNYVGNPVFDLIQKEKEREFNTDAFRRSNGLSNNPIVALLAGSRKHEIKALLPVMVKVAAQFPDHQFVVAGAPGIDPDFYLKLFTNNVKFIQQQTYKLLRASEAAIVTSGTATLETALLKVPQVVVYKMGMGRILSLFRKQILKTQFFSLVNLVAEKEVVKEYFQQEVSLLNLKNELKLLLHNKEYRNVMLNEYASMEKKIATGGAARNAAHEIVNSLKS